MTEDESQPGEGRSASDRGEALAGPGAAEEDRALAREGGGAEGGISSPPSAPAPLSSPPSGARQGSVSAPPSARGGGDSLLPMPTIAVGGGPASVPPRSSSRPSPTSRQAAPVPLGGEDRQRRPLSSRPPPPSKPPRPELVPPLAPSSRPPPPRPSARARSGPPGPDAELIEDSALAVPRLQPPPSDLAEASAGPVVAEAPPAAVPPPAEAEGGPDVALVADELSDDDVAPDSDDRRSRPGDSTDRNVAPELASATDLEKVSADAEVVANTGAADEMPGSADAENDIEIDPEGVKADGAVAEGEAEEVAADAIGATLDADGEAAAQPVVVDIDAEEIAPVPSSRKPPPPRRSGRRPPPPPPSATEPARPPPETKARARQWWEELFTDDFGRGFIPLTEKQLHREVDFIEESLGVAKGGVILDLACGTGEHAVELSSRGYAVVGYELSLPQLAVAGERAQERGQKINFIQGDMRELPFDETFDGIYCWNTSFGYFEEEKNIAVAQGVFKSLRPGGSFLLDVVNRDFVVAGQPSQVWFEADECVCMDDMSVDFITSRMRVKRTIMLDDGRNRECTYSIRVYGLHELGKMLHDIGFRVTEASGHPAMPGVFFGATSPRVIILAQKP